MMQSRTHNCGQLRLADAGRSVKIVGWMENIREVSSALAFIVVRDFYGTTQVVAETEDMVKAFKAVTRESTISVEGTVRERASKNPKLPTGDIEIVPEKLEVLGRCRYNELPFQINRSREADEATRLRYRYLDLRNPEVKANIILRSKVISALRRAMEEQGFMEITTPAQRKQSDQKARIELINAQSDAVLISIHQNFFPTAQPSGCQVLYGKPEGSRELGELTHRNLTEALCPTSRRVAAPISEDIYLMRSAKCTSILVECGFLSNPSEAALLQTEDYQLKISALLLASYLQYEAGSDGMVL